MNKREKESRVIYITHRVELLFWLVIIFILLSICTISSSIIEKKLNDYNIFMPDVDGLIVGSPVRIMGIEVGHITRIKPTNEEVFVKFMLNDKDMELPQGTVATVEFNGMAGSKSLELYLPDGSSYIEKTSPMLTVSSPKRLHDALGLLNDMFDKLNSIIYTTSAFGNKIKTIELPTGSSDDINDFLEYTDEIVNQANYRAEKFQRKIYEVYKDDNK